jgi:hypothetical protein
MKNFLKIALLYLKNWWNFLVTPKLEWKDIDGYARIYQISSQGDIYNIKEFKNVPTFIKNDGYECVSLADKNGKFRQFRVHRLVAQAFLPNPNNKTIVTHKDGDKTNNDVNNLRWV